MFSYLSTETCVALLLGSVYWVEKGIDGVWECMENEAIPAEVLLAVGRYELRKKKDLLAALLNRIPRDHNKVAYVVFRTRLSKTSKEAVLQYPPLMIEIS
jgi:hypothetical protein